MSHMIMTDEKISAATKIVNEMKQEENVGAISAAPSTESGWERQPTHAEIVRAINGAKWSIGDAVPTERPWREELPEVLENWQKAAWGDDSIAIKFVEKIESTAIAEGARRVVDEAISAIGERIFFEKSEVIDLLSELRKKYN